MWGWKQNSMITVNSASKEVVYNPEYYLLKHFSSFILPGASKVKTTGDNSGLLAFINPDKSIVIIAENAGETSKETKIQVGKKVLTVQLEPHSFNTFIVK
jgi:glucosylceramidase